jgi:hypothetical protein
VWAGIVGDCFVGLNVFPLQLTDTTEIFFYITCRRYWKLYHWQYMYNCTPAHFRYAVQGVLKTYHDRWIGRGRPTAWPPHSPDPNFLDFYMWEHLKSLVYAAPVDNEEPPHHCIVDACQTIRN